MDDHSTDNPVKRARRSCHFCARRKIRCSKQLPTCSSCKSHQRKCTYDKRALPETLGSEDADAHLAKHLVQLPPAPAAQENYRSSIRFLDHGIFSRSHSAAWDDQIKSDTVPPSVHSLLGGRDGEALRKIATNYFRVASPWLPIISKRRVFDHLLNPLLSPIAADAYFLLLCMMVITQPPSTVCPGSDEYYEAVQFRSELECSGALSLNILQGCLLLAVYEQGNAIFPAAHLSVGACFKQATALGLNWSYESPDPAAGADRVREEERRRVWWAIYLLERIQAIGNPKQCLIVSDPGLGAQLPWPEAEWDDCDTPSMPSTLSSPSSKVGRFSAIIQASYLLSNVYAHLSTSFLHEAPRYREAEQLHNTLSALMRYTLPESGAGMRVMCYFKALGTVATIILLEPYAAGGYDASFVEYAQSALDDAISTTATSAGVFVQNDLKDTNPGGVSPFILPWLYLAAKNCIRNDNSKSLVLIETAIARFERRWKVANAYADLLAAFKVMNLP